ncbi:MAG: hypothetical protein LDL33_13880 [Desulfomonile sp.]|nr:hypothetical protein [Desulfomonile sp.]
MASIEDLCWTLTEDLFHNVDLDLLYVRQLKCMGAEACEHYPYLILIHTGKITIAVDLSREAGCSGWTLTSDAGENLETRPRTQRSHIEDSSE